MKLNRRTKPNLLAKLAKLQTRLSKEKHPRPLWNVKGEWPNLRTIANRAKRRRIQLARLKERQLLKWQEQFRHALPIIAAYLAATNATHLQIFHSMRTVHTASHGDMHRQDLLSRAVAMRDLRNIIRMVEGKDPTR